MDSPFKKRNGSFWGCSMYAAGWQFGVSGTEAPFSEKELALEKAIAGSNEYGGVCCSWNDSCPHPIGLKFADSIWVPNDDTCI
ncbi:hypothetical protein [Cyclobacterium jeungdonense]|uniref:Uncharacterized protein n=1 Tax=Cyclobacterium jeungdonense TaxID=708087 RepID=A0ABT8C8V8_9BACT|nr:hypothetical protein [Cyclobacterium jeungdonense]MDN3688063.1 hypothetical protein [Cyclobacterium jeungdonense]